MNAERGEHPRPLWGLPQLVGHLALAFALVPAWRLARTPGRRATLERRFFRRALRAVGVEVRVTGRPVPGPGVLFVANHLSFTDIVALAPLLHATFVAKADVRRWPVMGRLVARFGTIFVERKRPMDATAQAERVAARLRAGDRVALFPEGTTSEGGQVLPFRSTLLSAATDARTLQPVALRYSDGARRAYIGDESLAANLVRLAPHRSVLTVAFLPPLPDRIRLDRKRAAAEARAAIADALARGVTTAAPPSDALPGCRAATT